MDVGISKNKWIVIRGSLMKNNDTKKEKRLILFCGEIMNKTEQYFMNAMQYYEWFGVIITFNLCM